MRGVLFYLKVILVLNVCLIGMDFGQVYAIIE